MACAVKCVSVWNTQTCWRKALRYVTFWVLSSDSLSGRWQCIKCQSIKWQTVRQRLIIKSSSSSKYSWIWRKFKHMGMIGGSETWEATLDWESEFLGGYFTWVTLPINRNGRARWFVRHLSGLNWNASERKLDRGGVGIYPRLLQLLLFFSRGDNHCNLDSNKYEPNAEAPAWDKALLIKKDKEPIMEQGPQCNFTVVTSPLGTQSYKQRQRWHC